MPVCPWNAQTIHVLHGDPCSHRQRPDQIRRGARSDETRVGENGGLGPIDSLRFTSSGASAPDTRTVGVLDASASRWDMRSAIRGTATR